MTKIEQKIPEGWSIKKISDVGTTVSGGTPDTNNPDFWGGDILWVTPSEVSVLQNRFILDTERKITRQGLKQSSAKLLPINSLIICTRATIGDCCINKAPMCTNQGFKNIIVKNNDVNFLYYLVTKNKKELIRKACGSTFLEISKKDIENLKFAIPQLPEQEKIAGILSCWDDGIEKLSALIEKKKIQKKALMQQLLTGKHRLKGYYTSWHEVKLGDISKISTGESNREDSSLNGKYTFFDRSQEVRTSNRYLFDGEAIIVAGEGQDFIPKYFVGKFDLHQRSYCIMNFKNIFGKFLFFLLNLNKNYFLQQAVGSTVKSLRLPMFLKMKLYIPSDLAEQKAIAEILSKADEEIELLNKKLEAFKQEKKALMQQLLTGKIRVKVN